MSEKIFRCRKSGLLIEEKQCKKCQDKEWCDIQRKIAETKARNNELNGKKIKHFGVWLTNDSSLKICRETYAAIDKRNSFWQRGKATYWMWRYDLHPEKYENSTCRTYTDQWCEEQRKRALENYDLNMVRFSKIPKERFENVINFLLAEAPFQKIDDLTLCNCSGIYLMVLDDYKQLYIGKAVNVKDRIKQHWKRKKSLDRLVWGNVEESVLSIDSFGALDTTRIYILPMATMNLDEAEEGFVGAINNIYLLNRVAGGEMTGIKALLTTNRRNFTDFPAEITDFVPLPKKKKKKPIREKYIRTVAFKHYVEAQDVEISKLYEAQEIYVEVAGKAYIGKVKNITTCYINIYLYGEGSDVIIEASKTENDVYKKEKRLAKKSIQKVSEVTVECYCKDKAFWKTVSHTEENLWE